MSESISFTVVELLAKLRERCPDYSSVPDAKLLDIFVKNKPDCKITYEGNSPVRISWERQKPSDAPAAAPPPARIVPAENAPASEPRSIRSGEEQSSAETRTDAPVGTTHDVDGSIRKQPLEANQQSLAAQTAIAAPSRTQEAGVSTPSTSAFTSHELQPKLQDNIQAAPVPGLSNQLPLATELPNWDLLPSENLLVRRRLAKK